MAKFRKKAVVVDAITFDELVEYGIKSGAKVENGLPVEFKYNGHSVVKQNYWTTIGYLISTLEGNMAMTSNDMLITGVKGEIYPCKKDIFEMTYEKDPETFLDRLEIELKELSEKYEKLVDFMSSDKFKDIPEEQRSLLRGQCKHMFAYQTLLDLRIRIINKSN